MNVAILKWAEGADIALNYRGIGTCYQVYCILCTRPVSLLIHITATGAGSGSASSIKQQKRPTLLTAMLYPKLDMVQQLENRTIVI
jgi:hypothetical protein